MIIGIEKVQIALNKTQSHFLIDLPHGMHKLCADMPVRKWLPKYKLWAAPTVKENIEYINDIMKGSKLLDGVENILTGKQASIYCPELFQSHKHVPRAYQKEAFNKLCPLLNSALFLEMGTGKTKIALDIIYHSNIYEGLKAALIVCPITGKNNWIKEIKKHYYNTDIDIHVFDSDKKQDFLNWIADSSAAPSFKFMIIGTQSLSSLNVFHTALNFTDRYKGGYAAVVDESSLIKDIHALRTQHIIRLGKEAHRRMILTGTSAINKGTLDLYSQFYFLDKNIIGYDTAAAFENEYAVFDSKYVDKVISYKNTEKLTEILKPYCFIGKKKNLLPELPSKTYLTRETGLSDDQVKLYKRVLADKHSIKNELERYIRLHQIAGGYFPEAEPNPAYIPDGNNEQFIFKPKAIPGNKKILEVLDIADETDESIVIWCAFKSEIEAVKQALKAHYGNDSVVELHGDIPEQKRTENILCFQENKARFIIGNAQTGGHAIDLTAGSVVIYYSNTFSYGDREQSEARTHRLGQEKPVVYIDLIAEKSIDRIIIEALKVKKNLADYIDGNLSRLSFTLDYLNR